MSCGLRAFPGNRLRGRALAAAPQAGISTKKLQSPSRKKLVAGNLFPQTTAINSSIPPSIPPPLISSRNLPELHDNLPECDPACGARIRDDGSGPLNHAARWTQRRLHLAALLLWPPGPKDANCLRTRSEGATLVAHRRNHTSPIAPTRRGN